MEPDLQARLLLVDDHPENILALEGVLADLGYDLVPAHSGPEALKLLLDEDFAVILLDVQMPGMDGFETARLIRERQKSRDIPIIFLTAINKERRHVFEGYTTGAIDYIFKPYEPDILRLKVAALAELWRKTRALQAEVAHRQQAEEEVRRLNAELEQRVRDRTSALQQVNRELQTQVSERTRAEKKVAASEGQLRLVTESVPALIAYVDRRARYRWVNRAFEIWFGRPQDEVVGLTVEELVGEEFSGSIRHHVEDVLAGREVTFEGRLPFQGGVARFISATFTPDFDERRKVRGFILMATDISERRRMEDQLREETTTLETLQRIGSTLAGELELEPLVQGITDATTKLTGAEFGAFFYNVLNDRGESYMLYTLSGVAREKFSTFPMPRNTAVFAPTFNGEGTIRLDDVTQDPRYGKNPPYNGMPKGHLPVRSYLAVPVTSRSGEVVGGLFFGHSRPGMFSERDERVVEGVAKQAAVAIDNARLYTQAQEADRRSRFLADASAVLASSLDYERTLAGLARLVVPSLADWCAVDLFDPDGTIRRLALAHTNPTKEELAWEMWRRYPPRSDDPSGPMHVLRTGESELHSEIPDEILQRTAQDEEQLRLGRELGLRSAMTVPLVARGRTLGAISLVTAESGRIYGQSDLSLAEDLGRRAAVAIDNARLYQQTQEAVSREQRRASQLRGLAEASLAVNGRVEIADVLEILTDRAREVIGAHMAIISLAETEGGQGVAAVSRSEEYERRWPEPVSLHSREMYSLITRTNMPVRLTRAETESDPEWTAFASEGGRPALKGWLAVPFAGRDGSSLGLIQLSDKFEGEFTDEDQAILTQFALLAASAIETLRLYEELRAADRAKDEFLAMLAHELRNPLAPMANALEILRVKTERDPGIGHATDALDRQLRHMVRLVDDLLDVSRITRGRIELRKEVVDVREIMENSVHTSQGMIEGRGHRLRLQLPSGPVLALVDPTRLEQVVVNLLNNAAKYTPPGGEITAVLRSEGGNAVIEVRDNGIGIAPELLPRVFDLFTQADRSLHRSQGGLGLGLTLVRRLVEMHGGSVAVRSEGLERGSEFTVRIPASERPGIGAAHDGDLPATADHGQNGGSGGPHGRALRVLVVDDNVDAAETLGEVLGLWGYEVHAVHDGPEAIDWARRMHPQIVLLDIGLPGMDGYEVARVLRHEVDLRNALIVAVSGYGTDPDRRLAAQAGFDHHFTKPVELSALRRVLEAETVRHTTGDVERTGIG